MQNSWESLKQVEEAAKLCRDCKLCETRTNVVFSRGNSQAKLMIIGEGPGQKEDETGLPFVGKAGQLLDKILEAGQICKDEEVYICNVVKCRPPQNRVPTQDEADACRKYLLAQIDFLKPKLILLAGSTAVQHILKVKDPISRIRGKWFNYSSGAKVMPIFHPSYLLRNESREPGSPKWHMWQDIKEVRKTLSSLDA
ncbi:MAG: uracil-DNA glycosylase [Candidatus Obscuribacterales bacterium]|nr:uracil-DNA glycosylase [Candidatus Obscuribacterales bacterium]